MSELKVGVVGTGKKTTLAKMIAANLFDTEKKTVVMETPGSGKGKSFFLPVQVMRYGKKIHNESGEIHFATENGRPLCGWNIGTYEPYEGEDFPTCEKCLKILKEKLEEMDN